MAVEPGVSLKVVPRRTHRTVGSALSPAPQSRTLGRPAGVEDEHKVARMVGAIEAGVPIAQACVYSGISERAHFRAMGAGERADLLAGGAVPLTGRQEAYRAYRARVVNARAKVAVANVGLVARAAQGGQVLEETTRRYRDPETGEMVTETRRRYAPGDWRAAKWLLEVSFRGEFGREPLGRVELTGREGGPVEVGGDDVLQSIRDRLHAVARKSGPPSSGPLVGVDCGPGSDAVTDVAEPGAEADLEEVGPQRRCA